jgi:nicotinamide-nucleotide amidase
MLTEKSLRDNILSISRQTKTYPLSNWFSNQLDSLISSKDFMSVDECLLVKSNIVSKLKEYRETFNINTVVLGMSGGIDSALTAALFKESGWEVRGMVLPIEQNPEETERGWKAGIALGISIDQFDLTELYRIWLSHMNAYVDHELNKDTVDVKIRKGNARARLRMMTLYNTASKLRGLVASTDNFSELTAGFWTRFGDEGDVAPIRHLWKSWEVPMLAKLANMPDSIIEAKPTDGLGIANGDEDQLGCTYLEWDIINMLLQKDPTLNEKSTIFSDMDEEDRKKLNGVMDRLRRTWYKRQGTIQLAAPQTKCRFESLANLDRQLVPFDAV